MKFEDYLKEDQRFTKRLNDFVSIKKAKIVLEIGACEAEDTIKLSRTFKNATIFSFEPLPKNFKLASQHLKEYKAERVELLQFAASDKNGKATFHVSSGHPDGVPKNPAWDYGNKSSSLLAPNKKSGHSQWLNFSEKISVKTTRIDSFCLDRNIEEIDFMHIDAQGAELLVLKGAGDVLQRTKAVWLEVEAIPLYESQPLEDEVERFMRESGFTCVLSTVDTVTGDKLYIRDNLLGDKWSKTAKENGPTVTVLMSVYNSQKYLKEAIDSILSQTYKDFEFLIINDGSKDRSLKLIESYRDPRIRLISRSNWGLTRSLNQGIEHARGKYIARQDSDDISVRNRLSKEVSFLDEHHDIGLVGSNYTIMDEKGKKLVTTNVFTHPNDLKVAQVTCNQYGHGSILARSEILRKLKGYDASVGHVEDYDLWTRISRVTNIANFEEPLFLYRRNSQGVTQQNLQLQIEQTFAVRDKAFQHFLKHRHEYKVFSWNPSGTDYKRRKATLLRDYAFLYRRNRQPLMAVWMLLCAAIIQPKERKNYRYIKHTLKRVNMKHWEYEFL